MATGLPLVEIGGSDPRERGRQYGELACEQIRGSIAFYRQSFERTAKLTWEQIQERAPAWVPLTEEYLPGIAQEMQGIAEGAGVRFTEILALNGRGELSYFNPFEEPKPEGDEGCSSFAITAEASGDGHVYCGQNWDWASGIKDTVILLRIVQPDKPAIVMQIEAGQVGRHGANSAGIGLNANGLGGRFPGKRFGLPGPYIRRKILESWTMHDALNAVFKARQAACTNLLLTHREGFVIDLETTPERHGWMYATGGLLVHANHFQAFVPEQIKDTYRPFSVDSLYRVPQIERVLKQAKQATTGEAMRELIGTALRDHFGFPDSVCNHADPRRHALEQTETITSSVVDLTTGEYWVALGTPCDHEYQRLPWNLYEGETARPEWAVNGHLPSELAQAVAAG